MVQCHAPYNRYLGTKLVVRWITLYSSFDKIVSGLYDVFWQDLCSIGITTLGPRKKILHALSELRSEMTRTVESKTNLSRSVSDETKLGTNKLITDFFSGPRLIKRNVDRGSNEQSSVQRRKENTNRRRMEKKDHFRNRKQKDVPLWCNIPGTPFRVVSFSFFITIITVFLFINNCNLIVM